MTYCPYCDQPVEELAQNNHNTLYDCVNCGLVYVPFCPHCPGEQMYYEGGNDDDGEYLCHVFVCRNCEHTEYVRVEDYR